MRRYERITLMWITAILLLVAGYVIMRGYLEIGFFLSIAAVWGVLLGVMLKE